MSKQIFQVHDISILEINKAISKQIKVPIDLPLLESGRIQYYETDNNNNNDNNIDWVIFKTIDTSNLRIDDIRFAIIILGATIFCVSILFIYIYRKDIDNDNNNDNNDNNADDDEYCDKTSYDEIKIMNKMKPIILGSAISVWTERYKDFEGVLMTQTAQDFCAKRANQHIAANDNDKYNSMLIKCSWESAVQFSFGNNNKKIKLKKNFIDMMESRLYNFIILFIIVLHILISLFEPATPKQLKKNGLNNKILICLIFCLFIEIIDLFLVGIKRFIEFSLNKDILLTLYEFNYDIDHPFVIKLKNIPIKFDNDRKLRALYLVFNGPKSRQYIIHCLLLFIIFINLLLTISIFKIGIFSYWIPILPFLFILRSKNIKRFGRDFGYALYNSLDVIFSYFCFIAIFSVFAMSLFDSIGNNDNNNSYNVDRFDSISHAIVTAFVYISTAENYSFIYNIFNADYYWKSSFNLLLLFNSLSFLLICGLMGLFCFIPMIIHRFEEAFNDCQIKQNKRNHFRKTNCIIAAFIMLDMNNDLSIDQQELKQLISKSILIDKNKIFDIFKSDNSDNDDDIDNNNDDGIDLKTFVKYLLRQTFRNKLLNNSVPFQSRFQAFLECNIFRRSQYNTIIFIIIVVPCFVISILKGLKNINNNEINSVLLLFFIINFIEINLKWFSFGFQRFFDLVRFSNPDYIIAAINKYYASQKLGQLLSNESINNNDITTTIRLTSFERKWSANYLLQTCPLSILEKKQLTLMHRIELITIYITFLLFILSKFIITDNIGYQIYFLQFGILLRSFTLLKTNQRLTFCVFTVYPQFIALLIFLFLYIYSWSKLGCSLFGDNITSIVIEDIYDAAPNIVANFNSSQYAILTLIQLLVGEGWHEVMYLNIIATNSFFSSIYFIIYITVVTIIISNVFIGLFLSGIDDLEMQQSQMKIFEKCIKSNDHKAFSKYAISKLKILNYKLSSHQEQVIQTKKQIKNISFLLKQHQKHTFYRC